MWNQDVKQGRLAASLQSKRHERPARWTLAEPRRPGGWWLAPNLTRLSPTGINYVPLGRIVVGTDGTVEDRSDGAMELDLV